MKKLFALLLALTFVVSMGMTATAAGDPPPSYTDEGTVTLPLKINVTNPTVSEIPAQTFNFTVGAASCDNTNVTVANIPALTQPVDVTFSKGDTTLEKNITINLPEASSFPNVGVYTYPITVTKTPDNILGMTYSDITSFQLKVTVLRQRNAEDTADELVRVPRIYKTDGSKISEIVNTYGAGSLRVTKKVTGNMADEQDSFTLKIKFTSDTAGSVKSDITYTMAGGTETSVLWGESDSSKEISVVLKHDESAVFENIPYGLSYEVTEPDPNANPNVEGYECKEIKYDNEDAPKKMKGALETVTVTNAKDTTVDTGITLDNLPYILILAVAAFGLILFFVKKRRNREY